MRSFSEGWTRVRSAPALLLGVYAMTLVLALPLAITMRGLLRTHLGASLAADGAANGVNYDWWQEFTSQATGIGTTFSPTIIGFAATLDNISSLLDGQREIAPIAGALAPLSRWPGRSSPAASSIATRGSGQSAPPASSPHRACTSSGCCVWRSCRAWSTGGCSPTSTAGCFSSGSSIARARCPSSATCSSGVSRSTSVFGLLLVVVNVIFDYAKIRIVVEDRRSALGALSAAMRFVWRQLGRVAGLYALNGLAFLILIAIWALVAPGARGGGLTLWLGFLVAQLYLLARLALKLQFLASETALFQSSLAHASYTAAPVPAWPESPAAELIR